MTPPISSSDLVARVEFLRAVGQELDVAAPVEPRTAEVAERWEALAAEAAVWRAAGDGVERCLSDVDSQLGGVDGSWDGAGSDACIEHLRQVGADGRDTVDAMHALADALDNTAESLRVLSRHLRDLVAEAAEAVHSALPEDPDGAREHLARLRRPADELAQSLDDAVASLARSCADLQPEGAGAAAERAGLEAGAAAPQPPLVGTASAGAAEVAPAAPGRANAPAAAAENTAAAAENTAAAAKTAQAATQGEDAEADSDTAAGGALVGGMVGGGVVGGGVGAVLPARKRRGPGSRRGQHRSTTSAAELFGDPAPAAPPVLGAAPPSGDDKRKG